MKSLYLALVLSLLMFMPANRAEAEKVLSVDIGQERIKAALIDDDKLTPDDLKEVQVYILPASEYSRDFSALFDPQSKKGLIPLVGEDFDRVYVLMRQPTLKDKKKIQARVHKPVVLERSAIGAMDGFLLWNWVSGKELIYPVAQVDFGARVTIGYASDASNEGELRLLKMKVNWLPVTGHEGRWMDRMKGPKAIMSHRGNRGKHRAPLGQNQARKMQSHALQLFLTDKFKRAAHTGKDRDHRRMMAAVNNFLKILLPQIEIAMKGKDLKTLVIAGGYANLIKKDALNLGPNYSDLNVIVTSESQLKDAGISADLVPLLGAFAHRAVPARR